MFFAIGLLSRPRGMFIYKAELVDLALGLIMEDFRPFAKALRIRETKFTSYRQDFHASHLGVGTISLVFQLFEMYQKVFSEVNRRSFSSVLDKAGYPNVMERFNLGKLPLFPLFVKTLSICIKQVFSIMYCHFHHLPFFRHMTYMIIRIRPHTLHTQNLKNNE